MIKRRTVNGHRIVLQFLFPYVLILLIPLAIGMFTYYKTTEIMIEEAEIGNYRLLEQGKDILDRRLNEIELIVTQLVNTPRIYSYQSVSEPFEGTTTYRTVENKMELYNYKLSNNFIFDYFIYYNQSDVVFSANSVYRLSAFYDQVYNYAGMSVEEWREFLSGRYFRKEMLPAQLMNINSKPKSMVTYLQSLGMGNFSRGTVVVLIDHAEIQKLLNGLVTSQDGWAYIADKTGRIISYLSSNSQEMAPVEIPPEPRGLVKQQVNGIDMMITYTTSEYNGWKYVVAQPSSVVLDKVNYIQNITYMCIFISLLIGIVIAYYMAYRNSKPLKTIIAKVLEQFGGEQIQPRNAYRLIEKTILRLANNNVELEKRMQEQIPVLKLTFFERLLKGDFTSQQDIVALLKQTGVEFNGNYYVVLIVQFRFAKRGEDMEFETLGKERVLVKEVLHNVMQGHGHIHDMDNDKMAILYAGGATGIQTCKRDVNTMMEKAALLMSIQLRIQTAVAAGGIYEKITDVSRSFEEARMALNQIYIHHGSAFVWYDDIPQGKNSYYYPAEMESRIMNLVKAGDVPETQHLLEQLYAENFVNKQLSLPVLRLFLYDLTGSLMKQAEFLEKNEQHMAEEMDKLLTGMEAYDDPVEIYGHLQSLYSALCREFHERKKSRNVDLKQNIVEYIHARYSDPDVCLTSVAAHFKMSEVYLSQFYKEQTGKNFSEHLENIRMEQARKLLLEGALNINEISHRVGYNSANTFGRAFKRIHGINATAFKQSSAGYELYDGEQLRNN